MLHLVTVVIGYRNREPERIKNCLDSLNNQTKKNFEVIFVDYGSEETIAKEIKQLVESYNFCKYVYNDTRGRHWNRAHALNAGIKLAQGEYIMTTDVDIIFSENFFSSLYQRLEPNKFFQAQCYLLPEKIPLNPPLQRRKGDYEISEPFGFYISPKKHLHQIQGFDEYYKIWGFEDIDLKDRLLKQNLTYELLPIDEFKLYHQWHAEVNHNNYKVFPKGWFEMMKNYYDNNKSIIKNDEHWGKIYKLEDRPTLKSVLSNDFSCYQEISAKPPLITYIFEIITIFEQLPTNKGIYINHHDKHAFIHTKTKRTFLQKFFNKIFDFLKLQYKATDKILFDEQYLSTYELRDGLFYVLNYLGQTVKDYYILVNDKELKFLMLKK